MVLFVTMVVLAVTIATTVTAGTRKHQRAMAALAVTGGILWTIAAAGLAILSGVHPALLVLVGTTLGYAVHRLTRHAIDRRSEQRPTAFLLLSRRRASRPADVVGEAPEREPLHWSVVAAAGAAATALEGYWAYQHLLARGGVFSDLSALAGFTVLATLTVAVTGVAGLAVHMRSAPRIDPNAAPMPAPSDMPTIAFTPIQITRVSRRRSRTATATGR